ERLGIMGVSPKPDASARSDTLPPPEIGIRLAQQVAGRVAAVPGVLSVGYADQLPLSPGNGAPTTSLQVPGRPYPDESRKAAPVRRVSAGYFETVQARMLRGRAFTEAEVASSQRVVIINQTTADRNFPGEDPIGRTIIVGAPPARQIVGVVADLKDAS